jgi:hypothetical protein
MTPRRGRPPLDRDDPSVSISVRVPSKQYDALCARAGQKGLTLPEMIRRALLALKNRRGA